MLAETPGAALHDSDLDTEYRSTAWRALSAFATEQHHALRHVFDSNPALETSGQIEHQHEASTAEEVGSQQSTTTAELPGKADHALSSSLQTVLDQHDLEGHVKAEVQRIEQRIMVLNPEKDVVVRLDFIRGLASRAASLAVTISLLIAAAVLLAQVIRKFQLVGTRNACHSTGFSCVICTMFRAQHTALLCREIPHISTVTQQCTRRM